MLRYAPADGGAAFGNLPGPVDITPGTIVQQAALPLREGALADSYVGWQGRARRGTLTVLADRESLESLGQTLADVVLFSMVPALLVATLIGGLVARSARDRVEAIRGALSRLTSGGTGARVMLAGAPPMPRADCGRGESDGGCAGGVD